MHTTPEQHELLSQTTDFVGQGGFRHSDIISHIQLTEREVTKVLHSLNPARLVARMEYEQSSLECFE